MRSRGAPQKFISTRRLLTRSAWRAASRTGGRPGALATTPFAALVRRPSPATATRATSSTKSSTSTRRRRQRARADRPCALFGSFGSRLEPTPAAASRITFTWTLSSCTTAPSLRCSRSTTVSGQREATPRRRRSIATRPSARSFKSC
eukprot:Amastigsp_a342322_18.p4 type:complete len:148 gc:universal Amastigsp_a342322_18:903-460(-)